MVFICVMCVNLRHGLFCRVMLYLPFVTSHASTGDIQMDRLTCNFVRLGLGLCGLDLLDFFFCYSTLTRIVQNWILYSVYSWKITIPFSSIETILIIHAVARLIVHTTVGVNEPLMP